MPHLAIFRTGWENEHLASFLLSRISFVAHPVTVADDVGSDFYCTLFEVFEAEKLLPRSSFAIQIKSSKDSIEATGKIEYFEKIELPFFVGVVDQNNLRLSIYSGEYLPFLFSHEGRPQSLRLSLEDAQIGFDSHYEVVSGGAFILRMPHVLNLEAHEDRGSIAGKGQRLLELCSRMHQNISSKVSCEYVFRLGDNRVVIYAGCGSALTFRDNFYNRLAEVFYNFDWLHRNCPDQFNIAEYRVFEKCYLELESAGQTPLMLAAAYQSIKQRLTAGTEQSQ